MGKILEITKEGSDVVMTVELDSGHREKWTYRKEETSTGKSITMVDREEV